MSVEKTTIKRAIDNIIKEGITDVELFSDMFEVHLLENEKVTQRLIDYYFDMLNNDFNDMHFKKNNYFLFPKRDFVSFRKCALIQLSDEIKYLSLVLSISKDIEKARLQKSKNYIFSYRSYYKTPGYIFDNDYNFQSFRNEIGKIISLKKHNVMIKCDISNFYDRLNIHRLISKLYTISDNSDVIKKLEELLLFWADRNSYSLPVGSNASRILAEAAMIDVDKYLFTNNIKFVRFVDDFRIFCKDVVEAQKILNMLIIRLDQEGLFLNSNKTELIDLTTEGDKFCKYISTKSNLTDEERHQKALIIRGYNGLIPTKFKKLSNSEIEKFKLVDSSKLFDEKLSKQILDSNDIVYLIKVLVANNKYDLFLNMIPVLKKYPQLIPYYISAFNKIKESINDIDQIIKMKKEFLEILKSNNEYPDYILIYIIRLFEDDNSFANDLYNVYLKSPRNINPYLGRRILEALEGKLERYQLLELKSLIPVVSLWEKREILRCLKVGLYEDEFKPIFKDYIISGYDEIIFDSEEIKLI